MKLSELTFSMALKQGADHFCMHYDASDCQRQVNNQAQLDAVKRQLMAKYGDVDITVNPDAPWFDVVTINDERWQDDFYDFGISLGLARDYLTKKLLIVFGGHGRMQGKED